jgi:hypothetical protein
MKYGLLQQKLKTLISNNEFYIIKMVVILETHGYLIKRNKFKIILKLLIYLNNQ